MNNNTEGDAILLDGKMFLLEQDLFVLSEHLEKGRKQFAPEVKPIHPPLEKAPASDAEAKASTERLRGLRMMMQLCLLRQRKSLSSESQ